LADDNFFPALNRADNSRVRDACGVSFYGGENVYLLARSIRTQYDGTGPCTVSALPVMHLNDQICGRHPRKSGPQLLLLSGWQALNRLNDVV